MGLSEKRRQEIDNQYIGKTYNYLTVLERDDNYKKEHNIKSHNSYYKCLCKCGNIKTVRITALTSGEVKSCGCLKKEQEKKNLVHGYNFIDLTGKKINFLTVIKRVGKTKDGDILWECKCDCGATKITRGRSLRSGCVTSCGCASMSRGELKIKEILESNNISFIYDEPYFKDLLLPSGGLARYDFILLDKENQPFRLIEFDGEQHYASFEYFGGEKALKKTKTSDKIKNSYAKQNGLPLIRIPFDKIEEINLQNLLGDKFRVV